MSEQRVNTVKVSFTTVTITRTWRQETARARGHTIEHREGRRAVIEMLPPDASDMQVTHWHDSPLTEHADRFVYTSEAGALLHEQEVVTKKITTTTGALRRENEGAARPVPYLSCMSDKERLENCECVKSVKRVFL